MIQEYSLWSTNNNEDTIVEETIKNAECDEKDDDKLYVITAGKNRVGRQQYISFYCDSDNWSICVVPSIAKRKTVEKVLEKVKKDLENSKDDLYKWDRRQKFEFEIKEVDENIIGARIYKYK